MINLKFDNKEHLLNVVLTGKITGGDILSHMKIINAMTDLPKTLNVLIDARKATFKVEPGDANEIASANFHFDKKFKSIKNAVLTLSPIDTALITLYKHAIRSRHYSLKIFSIEENARNWLKLKS
jgi:hypothetical protein